MKYLALSVSLLLAACATAPAPRTVYVTSTSYHAAPAQDRLPVASIYEQPPISQPEPIVVRWAPPPMLVEAPPPPPYPDAVWVGGYWTWDGSWVWAHGHWTQPPHRGYYWVHPYYENRGGDVVFVTGYWSPPDAVFVPPASAMHISVAWVAAGVIPGPRPIGPSGIFVPAPPGSRAGIIVPAPLGTPPAVVTSAPPVVNVGMRIQNNVNVQNTVVNNNVVNNNVVNNVTHVTNVRNVTNVTIVAPANAVANGQAVNAVIPAQAHLAAALPQVVNAAAPRPAAVRPPLPVSGVRDSAPATPAWRETLNADVPRPALAAKDPLPASPVTHANKVPVVSTPSNAMDRYQGRDKPGYVTQHLVPHPETQAHDQSALRIERRDAPLDQRHENAELANGDFKVARRLEKEREHAMNEVKAQQHDINHDHAETAHDHKDRSKADTAHNDEGREHDAIAKQNHDAGKT